jgi:hypothetical protein
MLRWDMLNQLPLEYSWWYDTLLKAIANGYKLPLEYSLQYGKLPRAVANGYHCLSSQGVVI